jgi:cytochrome c biogenesis protein
VALDRFAIQRDPAGRPEQFTSSLRILPPAAAEGAPPPPPQSAQISVNHPLRTRGITLYQADWALAAIDLQLGRSPVLQLPLQPFPQLGEQVWGLILPTRPDGSQPVLLALASEQGPVDVYGPDGQALASLEPGGEAVEIRGIPIRVAGVLPASGILLKRDPGVPLVYTGFAVILLGGGLSLIATRQIWAVADQGRLHVAGLCNRNLTAFAAELPLLLQDLENQRGSAAGPAAAASDTGGPQQG